MDAIVFVLSDGSTSFPEASSAVKSLLNAVLSILLCNMTARLSLSFIPCRKTSSSDHLFIISSASLPVRKSLNLVFSASNSDLVANVFPLVNVRERPSEPFVTSVTALPEPVTVTLVSPELASFQISFMVKALKVAELSLLSNVPPSDSNP